MLKVFLVEDEIIMREGIKNNIQWEKEGFIFAGEASDGELAFPMIQNCKPDILITDIKMPFMDGLELSRLVRQEMPDIKIIILSGYDEFQYAKEAISIGVTEYLVKPIASAQLLETVKKVEKLILEEKEKVRFLESLEKQQEEHAYLAKQKFFQKLVSGKESVSALLKEGKELDIDLAAARYNIVLFQIYAEGESEGYSEDKNVAARVMETVASQIAECIMIDRSLDGWAFILKETGEKNLEQMEEELLTKIPEQLKIAAPAIEYFGGVGTPVGRLGELSKCFEKANQAFAYRYFKEMNQIVHSTDVMEQAIVDEGLKLSSLNVNMLDQRIVENFLKTGLKSEITTFVEEYLHSLGESNVQSLLLRQYITMNLYLAVVSMLEKLGYESKELAERFGDFESMAEVGSTVEKSKAYLQQIFEIAIDLREQAAKQKYSNLLKAATDYIKQHYDDEAISLNAVAASVNISPNHFSTIFSQEMGQTFIEYLTWVRMEKAKELLRSTSMKTAEVAFAVGYKDPHYFSYTFKKTQKCTPKEFRMKN